MLAVAMSPPVAHYPAVQKRPKLSLQTSELPISHSASSRGISVIATPTAAVTPTTLNTFNNTFDLSHRPSPTSATASPSIFRSSSGRDRPSRSQSPHPKRHGERVYTVNLPFGIKPILKNTPFPQIRTNSISASPRSSTRRVFFPAPKKVCFRNVIEEEIVTKVYIASHLDLLDIGTEQDQEQTTETEEPVQGQETCESIATSNPSLSRRIRQRRGSVEKLVVSHVASSSSGLESEPATTPASGRKRRRWEWTLAPVTSSKIEEAGSEVTREAECLERKAEETVSHSPLSSPSSKLKSKTKTVFTLSLSSPSQLSPQRAGSLESSPFKRKAECLDGVDGNKDGSGSGERKRASTL